MLHIHLPLLSFSTLRRSEGEPEKHLDLRWLPCQHQRLLCQVTHSYQNINS
jgi:hypothetical protein